MDLKELHTKIGELTLQSDFLSGALSTQARLLRVARSTVYREPRPVPVSDLAIMRRIDKLHLDYPFAGSRSMLVNEGIATGRTHVRTLMRQMGIEALYRRPRTSKPGPGHKICPYLLRDVAVTQPNQVWAADTCSDLQTSAGGVNAAHRLLAKRESNSPFSLSLLASDCTLQASATDCASTLLLASSLLVGRNISGGSFPPSRPHL